MVKPTVTVSTAPPALWFRRWFWFGRRKN